MSDLIPSISLTVYQERRDGKDRLTLTEARRQMLRAHRAVQVAERVFNSVLDREAEARLIADLKATSQYVRVASSSRDKALSEEIGDGCQAWFEGDGTEFISCAYPVGHPPISDPSDETEFDHAAPGKGVYWNDDTDA